MLILGIETSCDETAASVVVGPDFVRAATSKEKVTVLSNVVSSQIEIHKKYGGVVPEVAAREHVLNILPVINEALAKAGIDKEDAPKKIDAIAVTSGPGLVTSLIVGIETAKTLAFAWKVPLISVNHIEGHIYANFIRDTKGEVKFPAVVMTVSGGHNMLLSMTAHGKIKMIGETLDDAAGEAFDKAAQMLGIGYPGGPAIESFASQWNNQVTNSNFQIYSKSKVTNAKIDLPRPMINSKDFKFSFSGLKTAFLYKLKKDAGWKKRIPEYAAEFQQAVVDVLVSKTIKAAEKYKAKTVMLSGGVSANKELRLQLERAVREKLVKTEFVMPDLKYTTDNAAMVAAAGYFKARAKKFTQWQKIKVDANLEL